MDGFYMSNLSGRHRHCKYCGLDFEPKNQWDEFCPPPRKCVEDLQKTGPIKVLPQQPQVSPTWPIAPSTTAPPPGWVFPSTGTAQQSWLCGICGRNVPLNEQHIHSFTFTSGN